MKLGRVFSLCAVCCSTHCAPPLSSFTPAHVAPVKHVQLELGTDVSIPTDAVSRLTDVAETLADRAEQTELTAAEQRQLLEAVWILLVNPPTAITHAGIGVGVWKDWEVQAGLVSSGWRIGGRYQVLHAAEDGVDLSTGLGLGTARSGLGGLGDLGVLRLDEFRSWNVYLPLQVGKSGDWYRWWGGPRIMLSSYHTGMRVTLPATAPDATGSSYSVDLSGRSAHLGGQLGGAIGYKHVFIAAELTWVRLLTSATLTTTSSEVSRVELATASGVIYPALGLIGEF